jgi:serine/threonine protein kinase
MPLSPGDRLGPYEILSPLGAGGMGEVYKARDTRLDRTVAVKVLPKFIADRDDLRARFEREARAVSSLKHPNICVLFDIGKQDGIDFMVLEHLEGETLAARVQQRPSAARSGFEIRHADRRRARPGASLGRLPSRRQAGQHHGHARRHQGAGFRAGEDGSQSGGRTM